MSNVRQQKNMLSRRDLFALPMLVGFSIRAGVPEAGARIAGWGTLTFPLPNGWRVQGSSESPPSLTLGPSSGRTFELRILPFTSPQAGVPPNTPESLRAMAEANAKFRAREALEPALSVRQSSAGDAFVYYYSFTDRAPKPGELPHLTEGLARAGGYPIAFVVRSAEASPELVSQVLSLVQQARRA